MRTRDAVRIEIRAAEIAQCVREQTSPDWAGREMGGWMREGDNCEAKMQPHDKEWQAGWLAAQIWYHFYTDGDL